MRSLGVVAITLAFGTSTLDAATPKKLETGTVRFSPGDQANTPERYRLDAREFPYELERKAELSANELTIYRLRYPSAMTCPTPENNTVHAEYYRPHGDGPFPAV